MATHFFPLFSHRQPIGSCSLLLRCLLLLIGLTLFLVGCNAGGESGEISQQTAPRPQLAQQAIENVRDLYRTTLRQEDIDRLQELLQPQELSNQPLLLQADEAERLDIEDFRQSFRTRTIMALDITDFHVTADRSRATFQELQTTIDLGTLAQRTRVFHTTFELVEQENAGTITYRIAAIHRQGPLLEITTPGQVLAQTLTRITVSTPADAVQLAAVSVEVQETQTVHVLEERDGMFHGAFLPPAQSTPEPLMVRIRDREGTERVLSHRYQLRMPSQGRVRRIDGTGTTRFLAVAVESSGTVWAGGDGGASVYRVPVGDTTATRVVRLLDNPTGRVEDLVVDDLGRLHVVFANPVDEGVIGAGVQVLAQGVLCPTVDVFAPHYPFQDPQGRPSVSTRAVAAGGGDIWLFGSDGGIARVADTFRDGQCPAGTVDVRYDPIFCRQGCQGVEGLPSNTVPAFVVSPDGALGFGTALGFTLRQNEQFTLIPFDRAVALNRNVATLEQFFQEVAAAIFDARPLTTIGINGVSFVELFGGPLIKEDLIFSLLSDAPGQFWVGTLGGGLRRLQTDAAGLRDTFLLTHAEVVQTDPNSGMRTVISNHGLGSNIVFALAAEPTGAIWAAMEEGVSRIHQEASGTFSISNYSPLDGLAVPVRDVVVDAAGVVWLATDGGLFRIGEPGNRVQGSVHDGAGRPVAGADVLVPGTPFRTVTDATGQFVLHNLPPESQQLVIDGNLALGESFTLACADVAPGAANQSLEPVVLMPLDTVGSLQLVRRSADPQTGTLGASLPLAVAVMDAQGNPVPALPVTFAVTTGMGTLASACVTTDASGQAAGMLTLTFPGATQVEAGIAGQQALVFHINGVTDVRLRRVSGNNQQVQPGELLPEPFVMRMEDAFGEPLAGVEVTAVIAQGAGELVSGDSSQAVAITNADGVVNFRLRAGTSNQDILVEASALGQMVQFLTIVGEVDTPDIPLDLAVAENVLFVADRRSGLQLVDVSQPTQPQRLRTVDLDGIEVRLAQAGDRTYVATNFPLRLYVLDANQRVLGRAQFPDGLRRHGVTGIAVQRGVGAQNGGPRDFAYLVTDARTTNAGTLQVVDVTTPSDCFLVGAIPDVQNLSGRPRSIAVSDRFAYIPAGEAGLLIFDLSDPARPLPLPTPSHVGAIFSEITLANGFAYVVETRPEENRFTILDLSNPANPQPLGSLPVRMTTQVAEVATAIAVDDRFAYLVRFASGLDAIDIRDVNAPRRVGAVNTPSQALNVTTGEDFLYVSDQIFGVQVIQRPTEADLDDTVADDPRDFVPNPLPPGTTTILVDANASRAAGNGTEDTPYRSLTDALRALRQARQAGQVSQDTMLTVRLQPSVYSPLTTQEIFPLDLSGLLPLTLQSLDPENPDMVQMTVIDAAFTGDIFFLAADPLPSNTQGIIEGLTLTHGAHGIFSLGSATLTVRQNRIVENIFAGISMGTNGNPDTAIAGNTISSNGQEGIGLIQVVMARVASNNLIQANGDVGISVAIDSAAEIASNTIEGSGNDGIRIDDGSLAMVTDNLIRMNGSFGGTAGSCIPIGNGIAVSIDSQVEITASNTIDSNRLDGILVRENASATIMDNMVMGNRQKGVAIEQASSLLPVIIAGNTISDNGGDGSHDAVFVVDTAAELTVADNTITLQSRGSGIALDNTPMATVTNNELRNNAFHGLTLSGQASATVEGNTIDSNGMDGISVDNATVNITSNIVQANIRAGLRLLNTSGCTATDNRIENNGNKGSAGASVAGILLSNVADTALTLNTVRGNAGAAGLILLDGSDAAIQSNEVCANTSNGILIQERSRATLTDNLVCENGDDGVQVGGDRPFFGESSFVAIFGGAIVQNAANGVAVVRASRAEVGLSGEIVSILGNGNAGIFVSGDASADIDSTRIIFAENGGGNTVGAVNDRAP